MSISLLYIQKSQVDTSGRLGIQVGILFIDLDEEAIGSLDHDIASKGFVEDGMISLEPCCGQPLQKDFQRFVTDEREFGAAIASELARRLIGLVQPQDGIAKLQFDPFPPPVDGGR